MRTIFLQLKRKKWSIIIKGEVDFNGIGFTQSRDKDYQSILMDELRIVVQDVRCLLDLSHGIDFRTLFVKSMVMVMQNDSC